MANESFERSSGDAGSDSAAGTDHNDNGPSLGGAIREAEQTGDIGRLGDTPGDAAGTIKRKRGRPVGWRKDKDGGKGPAAAGTTKAPNALNPNAIQFSLSGIHAVLASFLSTPELALTETEAEIMAKSIANVSRHYDLQASEKAMDWGNAVVAISGIYGLKIMSIASRKAAEMKGRRQAAPSVPVDLASPVKTQGYTAVQHPNAAGKPNGAAPITRKAEAADQILLNEFEPMLV